MEDAHGCTRPGDTPVKSPFENVILVRCVARIFRCDTPGAAIHAILGGPNSRKPPVEGILKRSLRTLRWPRLFGQPSDGSKVYSGS